MLDNKLKLGAKVLGALVVLLFLLFVSSLISVNSINKLVSSGDELNDRSGTIKLAQRMVTDVIEFHLVGLMMVADREYGEVDKSDMDRFEMVKKRFNTNKDSFLSQMDTEEEKKAANELVGIIQESINLISNDVIPAVKHKEAERAFTGIQNQLEDGGLRSLKILNETILPSIEKEISIATENAHKAGSNKKLVLTIVALSLIMGAIFSVLIFVNIRNIITSLTLECRELIDAAKRGELSRRAEPKRINFEFRPIIEGMNEILENIDRPIKEACSELDKMARGDLTAQMIGTYQGDYAVIKEAFNKSTKSMREALVHVRTTVDQVSSGSRQVADAASALSQGATESAASLQEITSSMNEVGGQTKQNAENATMAQTLSIEAKKSADKGNGQMNAMIGAMGEINSSSQNISKIIKVIDEIAFQTNLLALNAAVEAARAGKHGKGFAVVAEEVRNLAARSAKAAKETTELIEDSAKKVAQGGEIATATASALEEIMTNSTKVTDLVSEIASASGEQARGISQIVIALGQIDQVTQRNTASAEESASASQQLSSQAEILLTMVGKFVLGDNLKANTKSTATKTENKPKKNSLAPAVVKSEKKPIKNEEPIKTSTKDEVWGSGPTDNEPKIVLDDSEFGKY